MANRWRKNHAYTSKDLKLHLKLQKIMIQGTVETNRRKFKAEPKNTCVKINIPFINTFWNAVNKSENKKNEDITNTF